MSFLTGFAIYFIIWWVTLFLVLPYGVRSQAEENSRVLGTDPGAPVKSMIGRKLIVNSVLAAVIYAIYWIITGYYGWSLDHLPSIMPERLQ